VVGENDSYPSLFRFTHKPKRDRRGEGMQVQNIRLFLVKYSFEFFASQYISLAIEGAYISDGI
jgi:hypothetical protein